MDKSLTIREKEKELAVQAVEAALTKIREEGRQPDKWERIHLAQAIAWIIRGGFWLARRQAAWSVIPTEQRGVVPTIEAEFEGEDCNLKNLTDALKEARHATTPHFVTLGPITLR